MIKISERRRREGKIEDSCSEIFNSQYLYLPVISKRYWFDEKLTGHG